MKVLLLAGGAVLLAAAPVGATWGFATPASSTARTGVLQPVAAPGVKSSCLSDGRIGVTVSWSHRDANVTGYDVFRSTNGAAPVRVAQVAPTATQATDPSTAFDLASTFDYTVVSVASSWTAGSGATRLTDNRLCTGSPAPSPTPAPSSSPATGTATTI